MPAPRPTLVSLKRRADFLRVRGGARCATAAFVLEAKPREPQSQAVDQARFGFTVTKRLGKAVARNRIKRRLRAAARDVHMHHARPEFDYVVIARSSALDTAYAILVDDLTKALDRVHRASRGRNRDAKSQA
jgi:ribonuclease P protein component